MHFHLYGKNIRVINIERRVIFYKFLLTLKFMFSKIHLSLRLDNLSCFYFTFKFPFIPSFKDTISKKYLQKNKIQPALNKYLDSFGSLRFRKKATISYQNNNLRKPCKNKTNQPTIAFILDMKVGANYKWSGKGHIENLDYIPQAIQRYSCLFSIVSIMLSLF